MFCDGKVDNIFIAIQILNILIVDTNWIDT